MSVVDATGVSAVASLALDADNKGFTFVPTGGLSAAGGYTVTLSAAD